MNDNRIVNGNSYEFGEPVWAFAFANTSEGIEDYYLIRISCAINGRRCIILGRMIENPKDNPDLYAEIVEKMKADFPGIYERGEIQDTAILVAD